MLKMKQLILLTNSFKLKKTMFYEMEDSRL